MRPLTVCLLLALSTTALTATAQQRVYQWKDANGVTQYSQSRPGQASYQTRDMDRSRDPEAPAPKVQAESANCVQSRANLKALSSTGDVLIDSDGDGKPDKTLDETGRANQRGVAEANIKAFCSSAS